MAAKKVKALTTITEYEEQELSLAAIEWLPESLQVRENLDKGWVLEYSRGYTKGDPFPPVLVYRLPADDEHPTGRLVLADGFHRVDAARSIGLKTIRAQIREGTLTDALLAAIEANTAAFHRGRRFEEKDQHHAAEMMIKNRRPDGTWDWSDTEIARICGCGSATVGRIRRRLSQDCGVDIPDRVKSFNGGIFIGRWSKYKQRKRCNVPYIHQKKKGNRIEFQTTYCGQTHYLGTDKAEAERKASVIASRFISNLSLGSASELADSLNRRGIGAETISSQESFLGGVRIGDAVVFPVANSSDFYRQLCKSLLARKVYSWAVSVCLVGRTDGDPWPAMMLNVASVGQNAVLFLTPEQFIAEFGSRGEDSQ